jgi:hypothetical protein
MTTTTTPAAQADAELEQALADWGVANMTRADLEAEVIKLRAQVAAPAQAQPSTWEAAALPRCVGVGRDAESPGGKSVSVAFEREPSDDELRTLHNMLATTRTAGSATPVAGPGWTVEWDAYSPPGTIRVSSQKWGGCFLGKPEPHDISLPALAYRYFADVLATPTAPVAEGVEAIQWRNIRKVVKELAAFCFGDGAQCGQITLGAAYTALVNSLAAKDGLDVRLEPLATQPAEGLTEQHRQKAARWDYMMLVADNNDGPEAQEMARICDELPDEDGRPESEQLAEVVDRAVLAQQAKKGSDHA